MKPYYFKSAQGNVGDDINEWIWKELLDNKIDDNSDHLLIGIGTLLNHRIPQASQYTVISSGIGYGNLPPLSQGQWNFVGVRGPITKKTLGIHSELSLLDGAYLLPQLRRLPANNGSRIGYIPHVESIILGNWEAVCSHADILLIDPRQSIEDFLTALSHCDFVITEAMHGAIIADAYGIPWVPAKAHDHINERKWQDWSQSVEVDIQFNYLNPVWKDEDYTLGRYLKHTIKRNALIKSCFGKHYTPAPNATSSKQVIATTAAKLKKIAQTAHPQLSSRPLITSKVQRLNDELNKIKDA